MVLHGTSLYWVLVPNGTNKTTQRLSSSLMGQYIIYYSIKKELCQEVSFYDSKRVIYLIDNERGLYII
jgi:hypothetical protein